MFKVPEKYRITEGQHATSPVDGNNGAFIVFLAHGQRVMVIAADGLGWEHVSVSRRDRCPTWEEMCQIKALFWDREDCVVQYHPPESDYVNNHPYCLHLWREVGKEFNRPPSFLVGRID